MLPEETVNILLVDDHPENLLSLGAILETPSYNLVKALSGEEALKCLLYQDFAVVLMDVQMPGMDGFEVAAIIRERKRSRMTPIIFLTAIDQTHNRVLTGYGLGAVDYLFKPVVPEILQSKIMVFVGLFRKTEEIKRQATQVADVNQQLAEEIIQRKQVEEALQKTHDELEIRVQERTAELTKANSELRQSEQRYRFLADAMAHIVWTAQPDGGVDYYNQRWYDYTGTTFERTQNWEWQSVLHPDDQERCLECWIEAIRTGSSYQTESRFKQAMDGAYR